MILTFHLFSWFCLEIRRGCLWFKELSPQTLGTIPNDQNSNRFVGAKLIKSS